MIRIHVTQKDLDRARNTTLNPLYHAIKRRLKKPADVSIHLQTIYIHENTGKIDSRIWVLPIPSAVLDKLNVWKNGKEIVPFSFNICEKQYVDIAKDAKNTIFKK